MFHQNKLNLLICSQFYLRFIVIMSALFKNVSISFTTDDPYYCGMRARVPNFVKANKANRIVDNNSNYISSKDLNKLMKEKEHKRIAPSSAVAPLSTFHQMHGNTNLYHHHLPSNQQYSMWHAKSYESGIGKRFTFGFIFFLFADLLTCLSTKTCFPFIEISIFFFNQILRNHLIKSMGECRYQLEVMFQLHECT
jgi:hypothetical protein